MPPRTHEPPPSAEWDFSVVPSSETYRCCVYEYAREAEWFREAVQSWRERFFGAEPPPDATSLLGQSVHLGRLIIRASATRPDELDRVVEPGARGLARGGAMVLRAFPGTPWQGLEPDEKRLVARFVQTGTDRVFGEAYRQLFVLDSSHALDTCADATALEALLNERFDMYVFQIAPEATRNQVELAFRNWLRETDRFPGRGADARTTTEKSSPESRLKQLAIRRLQRRGTRSTHAIVIRTATERCRTPGWVPERLSDWHAFPERANSYRDKLFPPENEG